jgi:hypothetical protein
MEKDREQLFNEMYEDLLRMPRQVLSIFSDYYGEEKVELKVIEKEAMYPALNISSRLILDDLSEEDFEALLDRVKNIFNLGNYFIPYILVQFGDITVTNEYNKSIDIEGLWAKISLRGNGELVAIELNRSRYSYLHWEQNYLHSHVDSISKDDPGVFRTPCIGRGPIANTSRNLRVDYDETRWQIFCYELDKFVHTESLTGGPYHKLEAITNLSTGKINKYTMLWNLSYGGYASSYRMKDFERYLLQKKVLKFNYLNHSYGIGIPFMNLWVLVSNCFIEWCNLNKLHEGDLLGHGVLVKGVIKNSSFYELASEIQDYSRVPREHPLFDFKGQPVFLELHADISESDKYSLLLNPAILEIIMLKILAIINLNYGNTHDESGENPGENIAPIKQAIRIL